MRVLDNITNTVRDELIKEIKPNDKVSIAAAFFSMYAYKELKKQLESVESFRFIFTSPTFIKDKAIKEKREFYIPRLTREKNLYGTEFEIKLRNEMTQKSIAKECANWIRKKAKFKSNITDEHMQGFIALESQPTSKVYYPINGFTTVDIGCDRGNFAYNYVTAFDEANETRTFLRTFDEFWNNSTKLQDVTDTVINNISTVYAENSPEFIYFMTLYHVFSEFLDDISEDVLPNEATGFKQSKIWNLLYDFQKDAALAIINKLEKYNGCILADSVGLGKTYTALAVMKYYENRNKSVLVLCPKKLAANWNTYKDNYVNNPIASDRMNYTVLFHTDLSRSNGVSNGIDLSRLNWSNFDLIVIDESHNFRNGYGTHSNTQENRYKRLMDKVIKSGVKTKVLMLSATPVNTRFNDLKNQIALSYEGNSEYLNEKINTNKGIEDIFKQAQRAFNDWSKLKQEERTTDNLLKKLDFDFFELLDNVTIARSRKHIEKYYNSEEIGKFPERLKPISLRPHLTDLTDAINYNDIYDELSHLFLYVYTPSNYILPSKIDKYKELNKKGEGLTQIGRERGIQRLMNINLLKRLESSVNSFQLTLTRINTLITNTINAITQFEKFGKANISMYQINEDELDIDDENTDFFTVGRKVKIDLADMDWLSWRTDLQQDKQILDLLNLMIADITPEHDSKLQQLIQLVEKKITHPINVDNKKILIFSAFADTAMYLYENISKYIKEKYGLNTAVVTGSVDGRTTINGFTASLNNVLTCFSPLSKDREVLMPNCKTDIDILIATDCISEGQNLQDCDYLINYDIHWNPVRIIQRFGRIDRIGSKNDSIQLVNFWPDLTLDDYINLKSRVETRMKITVMTTTGDDNLINPEDQIELEYRKAQLKKLQEEVVDIEDMSEGISIMDLGLNEFRLDLLDYIKHNDSDLERKPKGLHAVTYATKDLPEGVIFVLKNINNSVNIDNRNRIHPFYMVYITNEGEINCDYLNPKKLLDDIRLLCRGKSEPIPELYIKFNQETKDGRDMATLSELLSESINSIISTKENTDIQSLFFSGGTSALLNQVSGLEDFELICFLVIRN